MNVRKRMASAMLMIIMMCSLCVSSVLAEDMKETENVTILFTHDMHSHMDSGRAWRSRRFR